MHFEVVGSDTGTRYRIRHGRMMNIDELDSAGNKVCEWCFLPAGNLAIGDVMLAQKIALETYESGALAVQIRQALGMCKSRDGKHGECSKKRNDRGSLGHRCFLSGWAMD
jgi:hypothetical protein